jgi:DNA polymerase
MPILFRDYETRSTQDIKRVGAWMYARHATTDVWCCAYAVDDGDIKLWVPGDPIPPEFIEAANNPEFVVSAFNAAFERAIEQHIMAPRYGWSLVPLERQRCSQAAALALALPAALDKVAAALELEQQKDEKGKRVMLQMARPRCPRQHEDPNGLYWFDDLGRRGILYPYCIQDVATERAIHHRIAALSPTEQALWRLNTEINERGIPLDVELLNAALAAAHATQSSIGDEFTTLTEGSPANINQAEQLLSWLQANGCDVKDIRSTTLEAELNKSNLPPTTRRVIELRLAGAHASAIKLKAMRNWCDSDGRIRGTFRYHGASTGRFTSMGVQLQNLKRPETDDLGAAVDAVRAGDISAYDRPMAILGELGRAIIAASPGHRFIAADLSGIESRITAWVSGQQSKVDQWAKFDETGNPEDEPYYCIGRDCFGLPEDTARSIGKIGDLAFGYSGGVGAWRKFSPNDQRSDEEIKALQQKWRNAHEHIAHFWRKLDRWAITAVKHPGKAIGCERIAFCMQDVFLKLRLPSKRKLAYPFARIDKNDRGDEVVVFKDNQKGQFTDCRNGRGAYGGLWLENVVQAIARDIFTAAMPALEAAGYPIVLHVHDEIVTEVPDGVGSAEEFLRIITTRPLWANGLPLAAKVRNGLRFAKASKPAAKPTAAPPIDFASEIAEPEPPNFEPEPQPPKPKPEPQQYIKGNGYRWNEDAFNGYQRETGGSSKITKQYVYKDPAGRPYLRVNRKANKGFPQDRWNKDAQKWEPCKGDAPPPIPYRLPELIAADPAEWTVITEGEKDADTAVALGFVATCNSGGAGKFLPDHARWLIGKQRVIICEDNDEAGRQHIIKTAAALHGIVPDIRIARFTELPEKGDLSDWAAMGYTRDQLIARTVPAPKPTIESIRASAVQQVAIQWIWKNRFARGKLGIIAGLPDEGKGLLFNDIMARITRGSAWPCGEGTAPLGNVLLLTAEDDIEDTVTPRLIAAGADLDRVEILRMVPAERGGKRMFSLVTDLERLRTKILEVGDVQAVLIDPITSYLGVKQIDSFRTTDVRAVLAPLVDMAAELGVLILVIMHFNKKLDVTNVLLRISDSLAFGATSRHCYAVVYDLENKRSLLVKGKNNLAPKEQKALAFTVDARETGICAKTGQIIRAPYIIWAKEPVDVTAVEAMEAVSGSKAIGELDRAKQFLTELLGAGPMPSTEIEEAAKADGIAIRTLRRAKDALKIKPRKDGQDKDGQPIWRWHQEPSQEAPAGS